MLEARTARGKGPSSKEGVGTREGWRPDQEGVWCREPRSRTRAEEVPVLRCGIAMLQADSASMGSPARPYERPGVPMGKKPRQLSRIRVNWMVCQYSRRAQVSIEKQDTAASVGAEDGG
jgi:hypothetical protein